MTELDPFGAPAGAPSGPTLGNRVVGAGEEDPAAAFLVQQESEIAGIENDEAFANLDGGAPGAQLHGEPPGALDANSRKQEAEWKEKAIKELEEWYVRQDEQLQKTKANNRTAEEAFVNDIDESSAGTEWERVARLCDFNPKSRKQAKDISRMYSVLISLKQAPLVH
ncbi:clathrin light chain A-like isoform X2 [Eumetopias jubatus]|uniref:clathrin light chain A-like isoform X2 n=1 Tax=Eumetopias jubatus TaxID=34886 RepID=UPI001016BAEA|nr:clathrin light chain A-like isoform X2 [Eumetopias jubatus]